jgi:hypothetical protein
MSTASESVNVVEPAAFCAVRTEEAAADSATGVPVIFPLDALSERPSGNAGEIEYVVTLPVAVGVIVGACTPTVGTTGLA